MWVRAPRDCAPEFMVSSLDTLKKPYFPSDGNVLFVVRDAHRNSAVTVQSYVPYFCSGRKALCMYGHTYSKSMDQPGKVVNPARGQLNRENEYFSVPVHA